MFEVSLERWVGVRFRRVFNVMFIRSLVFVL